LARAEWKNFSQSDQSRTFGHGKVEFVKLGSCVIRRMTLEPGWRWSRDMGPIAKTEWCEASHFQYHVTGRLRVQMEDGTEFDLEPGDVALLPNGHDTWVIGNEPVVLVDWYRATDLLKVWAG
jgi:hypothetical protein